MHLIPDENIQGKNWRLSDCHSENHEIEKNLTFMKISFEHFFKAKMGVRVLVMVWSDLSSIATGQVRDVHHAMMALMHLP